MASNPRSGGSKKKGPPKGSGGKHRRSLQGKGPTPKAEDRVYHKAHKAAQAKRAANASAQAKRKTAHITGNMCSLLAERRDIVPYLSLLLPDDEVYLPAKGAE